MTKTQRRLAFHESFEALVQTLGDVLPAEHRAPAQQQLLDDAKWQITAPCGSQAKLTPNPISTPQRRQARYQRMQDQLCDALRIGQVTIRSIKP